METISPTIIPNFKTYNRYQEMEKRQREMKELAWERELLLAMNASNPLNQTPDQNVPTTNSSKVHQHTHYGKSKHGLSRVDEASDGASDHERLTQKTDTCSNKAQLKSREVTGEVQNRLQNLDFIDRTPSPIERLDGT